MKRTRLTTNANIGFCSIAGRLPGIPALLSAAAKPLAELLSQPEMRGHTVKTLADTKREGKRTEALRELMLARALFLLGDHDGVARKVLEDYTQDLRGHFARHATAVLAVGAGKKDH